MDLDRGWALSEGGRFFEGKSEAQLALRKITKRLNELGIAYCVAGGMALFHHGYRRFTDDVDILVTSDGLKQIHSKLDGLGYVRPFELSKNLRDTELGVRVEFLIAGQFPGDGKPKPVCFPHPASACVEFEGVQYLNLPKLVELKLASGMTSPGRMKDLSDVLELIKVLNLSNEFGDQLDPFVQPKYKELWTQSRSRFILLWRNKWLTAEALSIEEMIASLRAAAELLETMRADGVTLDPEGGTADDYAHLVTLDPEIAKKYGMHEESEFWGEDRLDEDHPKADEPDDASH
jgi:hypothetical protein